MIRVAHLAKTYGHTRALHDICFDVEEHEKVLLLGPNGAGKTTLLRILAGIVSPSEGEVRIGGIDPQRQRRDTAQIVGYAGHRSMLYGELPVEENLRFFGKIYGLSSQAATKRTELLLETVDMAEHRSERVKFLSQGQQQRIAIARALVHDPPVLLLDEPFAGLDAEARAWLTSFLATTAHKTVLFATHQPELDLPLARRALVLVAGHLAHDRSFSGEPDWRTLTVTRGKQ